ncbi:DNA helicase [Modestobacter sp. NPDC049651]|uniref:DNA helicase n=1 Tax=unclassified Modestobacter TaxID=2643866 RepID=UPI0033D7748B
MGDTADLQLSTGTPVAAAPTGPSLDLDAVPVLSAGLAAAGVPVVSRLTVTSPADLAGPAVVRLAVQDAEGAIGAAVEVPVDLVPGGATVLPDPGLLLDPATLRQVPERRPGWVRAELHRAGRVVAHRRVPVHVLAPSQWLATPLPLALEVLAVHVHPDDAALTPLLAGLPAGSGTPEQVDRLVATAADALRRRSLRRLPGPATWAGIGSSVRTPEQLLDERAGTPLDLTLALAALLERAGLRPLVVLAEGAGADEAHAFLGCWRTTRAADAVATTDAAVLAGLVAAGDVRLVETALLTAGGPAGADLHAAAADRWLGADRGRLLGVTDVARARTAGLRPLGSLDVPAVPAELRAAAGDSPLAARLIGPAAEPALLPAPAADLDELAAQLPLPADGSQLAAVATADTGTSFVLTAAPGTGATQTVVNAAARAVATGRTTLVVAPPAALDPIARRLAAAGLGPLTLRLDGARPVADQLRTALAAAPATDPGALAAARADLAAARAVLDRSAEQLHARNAAGHSTWSASAVLAGAGDTPALPVPAAFVAGTTDEVTAELRRSLALLPDVADLARPATGHAWAFVDAVELDLPAVHQAAVRVDRAVRALPGEGRVAHVVRAARTPEDLDVLAHLLTGPAVTLELLDVSRGDRWAAATAELTAAVGALTGAAHPGLDLATPAALALPLAELDAQARAAAASSRFGRGGRLKAVLAALLPVLREGVVVRPADVPQLTGDLLRLQTEVRALAGRADAVPGLAVPAGWNPFLDAGRFTVDSQIAWLRRAAAAVEGATGFAPALRRFLAAGPVADAGDAALVVDLRTALAALLAACRSSSKQLVAWSDESGLVLQWTMTRPERGVEYTHPMSLRRWVSLLDTLEPLRIAGLHEARRLLLTGAVPARVALRAFEHGLAQASLAERWTALALDDADPAAVAAAAPALVAAARAVRAQLTTALPAAAVAARDDEALAALRRALAAARPPADRELLSRHTAAVLTATPVVLADPAALADLPARELVDQVLVCAAQQLTLADGVAAVRRGRSAVVAGDPSLPGPDDAVLAAALRAGLPRRELGWQHRSRDESLFAFPNAHDHGLRVRTVPAPRSGRSSVADGRGVALVRVGAVPGPADRPGTNPVEASTVVAEVLRRFDASPAALPSLAITTLTAAQRDLVLELLRECGDPRVAAALDAPDGLLVRELAAVDGAARDVVLLSLGVTPDAGGRVPLDLGPLSQAGGERWLTAAVTAARRQLVVVASFAPAQLPATETAAAGVRRLRGYLLLAERGTGTLPAREPGTPDQHVEDLAAALRGRGLVVRTDVGLGGFRVDLAVARLTAPDSPVLAVLLDGPAWAARSTAGDRDELPLTALAARWPAVERVSLLSWLADRPAVVERLVAAVEATPLPAPVRTPARAPRARLAPAPRRAPEAPPTTPPAAPAAAAPALAPAPRAELRPAVPAPAPVAPAPVVDVPTAGTAAADAPVERPRPARSRPAARTRAAAPAPLDEELPFVAWAPKPTGEKKLLDQLADPAVAKAVRRVLTAGVKAEGPVSGDRLARLTAGAFGLTRVGPARRDALLALLPKGALADGVAWPAGSTADSWTWFRRQSTAAERPLDQVPAVEIGNAMVGLCRADGPLAQHELFRRTGAVFGNRRPSPALVAVLDVALARALAAGRLTELPDGHLRASRP